MAQVIPQAGADRRGSENVVTGDQKWFKADHRSEQRCDQQQQLQRQCYEVDGALPNQNQIGDEGDDVERRRCIAQPAVAVDHHRVGKG